MTQKPLVEEEDQQSYNSVSNEIRDQTRFGPNTDLNKKHVTWAQQLEVYPEDSPRKQPTTPTQ